MGCGGGGVGSRVGAKVELIYRKLADCSWREQLSLCKANGKEYKRRSSWRAGMVGVMSGYVIG